MPITLKVLIALTLLFFVWTLYDRAPYKSGDPSYNRVYWEGVVSSQGEVRAYELFKQKNSTEPEVRQHFAAHVMGMVLFETRGTAGLAVCDASFGFGCYHGHFSSAVAEGGIERVQDLDAVCNEKYGILGTGCRHGIGHGILEYVGYDRIEVALSLCGTETQQVVPLLGCTSGVFMEYLSPLTGEVPRPRSLDLGNPYEPCTQIDKQFKDSCYYELGQWFHRTQPNSVMLCGDLQGEPRARCFLGFGSDSARLIQDTDALVQICRSLLPQDERSCRAGAMWGLFSAQHMVEARALCAYADSTEKDACVSEADLTEGRDSNFPS